MKQESLVIPKKAMFGIAPAIGISAILGLKPVSPF
jgi:hypothetical protein